MLREYLQQDFVAKVPRNNLKTADASTKTDRVVQITTLTKSNYLALSFGLSRFENLKIRPAFR
jgi:hypothetical protein